MDTKLIQHSLRPTTTAGPAPSALGGEDGGSAGTQVLERTRMGGG
jgi:hypothetical protein